MTVVPGAVNAMRYWSRRHPAEPSTVTVESGSKLGHPMRIHFPFTAAFGPIDQPHPLPVHHPFGHKRLELLAIKPLNLNALDQLLWQKEPVQPASLVCGRSSHLLANGTADQIWVNPQLAGNPLDFLPGEADLARWSRVIGLQLQCTTDDALDRSCIQSISQ